MNSPKSFAAPTDPRLIALSERYPWINLENLLEVEAWIQLQQDELQLLATGKEIQPGINFAVQPEGEVYLYTNQEGEITIELSDSATWLEALLPAIHKNARHVGRIWHFPADTLVALIWGLNPLISASQLVSRKSKRLAL